MHQAQAHNFTKSILLHINPQINSSTVRVGTLQYLTPKNRQIIWIRNKETLGFSNIIC